MNYQLNPQYQINTIEKLLINPEYQSEVNCLIGKYLLINESKGKVYVINDSIYHFLNHFLHAQSKENILLNYIEIGSKKLQETEKAINNFFMAMVQKKILIPEGSDPQDEKKILKFDVGNTIDGFVISEIIANKSNVEVYKTMDTQGKISVFKLAHREKFSKEVLYEKALVSLQQEYQLLQKLSEISGVINSYNFEKKHDFAFLEMEFAKGENLSKWIQQNREQISLKTKLKIISQVLKIFSQIHQNEIIHCDIHPANFMIHKGKIKVIDFGNSQHEVPKENEILKTGGVSHYMPPERIQPKVFNKFINHSNLPSEVYQLGVLLYFILYENVPFKSITWKNLAHKIMNEDLILTEELNSEKIPNAIIQLIKKATNKNPNHRFANAEEMYFYWKNQNY